MGMDSLTLLGRDWLQLDWAILNHVSQNECKELISLLDAHSACLVLGRSRTDQGDDSSPPLEGGESTEVLPYLPSPCALQDKVAKEIDRTSH